MDRRDGKRVKDINGMEQLILDIKPNRSEADVFIQDDVDVTNLMKYLDKAKKEGRDITIFHAVLTAFAKTIYNRPKLNRFIANRHVYEHNEVTISFVAKVAFTDKAEEIMLIIPVDLHDNIDTISKKIKDKVESIRNEKDISKKGANGALDTLGRLPNIIRVPLIGLFKWMDQRDLLPKSLTEDNLYYSSAMMSNIGSLGSKSIYHNNTNFGTCSSMTTIGVLHEKEVIEDKKKKTIKVIDFGINFDERVADGFYLIRSFDLFKYILNNPELLDDAASKKYDINK